MTDRSFNAALMARAAMTRVANAQPVTLNDATTALDDWSQRLNKRELCQVLAYLAALNVKRDGEGA